ncbi:RNA polymerase II-associated protein 3-like isoform X2 [Hetaerina americana]|uniref:RNA polymerase II-associated protein 3-like isoform X2 n=1 Tax=Hetaerina americana TaxID=62018 RepID=UPI003A7F589F
MDPFSIQKLVKENAEDLSTYLRDLKNWEADIKKKDAELRGIDTEEELYPEIRSKQKESYGNKGAKASAPQKKKRISAFDYESWDKLDVEKVCEEIDSNEEQKMKVAAMYEKEMGNNHLKAGNLEKAIDCYTKAIKAYPRDAIFFANRGLCYLKLKDFERAERDCSTAISIDCSYVKAWLRRSSAWEGLGNVELAKRDLQRVISLEPCNSGAKSKLAELEKMIQELESKQSRDEMVESIVEEIPGEGIVESPGKQIDDSSKEVSVGRKSDEDLPWKDYQGEIIQPINKPPHLRSKKPLRLVPVKEVNGSEPSSLGCGGDTVSGAAKSTGAVETCSRRNLSPHSSQGNVETLEPAPSELPPPPKSSVQFLMNWKRIKMYPEMAVMYLKQIPPESLPSVFGDSLEISNLEEMLSVLGRQVCGETSASSPPANPDSFDHHSTYAFLRNLANVPRFSTLAMFLNLEEQAVSRQLLAKCVESGECSMKEAADLAGKFML